MVDLDLPIPLGFILGRPHAEYASLAAIKTQPGSATGNTYVRDGIFSVGEDATVQEVGGQFTFHSKSIVTNEKNVVVCHNTFINGYHGGMNAKVIQPPDAVNTTPYDPSTGKYGAGHSLANAYGRVHYADTERPSVLVLACTYGEAVKRGMIKNPLTLHGKLAGSYGAINAVAHMHNADHGFSTLDMYTKIYQFMDRIVPSPSPHSADFVNDVLPTNAVMFRGHTRYFNPKEGVFGTPETTLKGTGHWGPEGTYLGCNRARRGDMSKTIDR